MPDRIKVSVSAPEAFVPAEIMWTRKCSVSEAVN